MSLLGVASEVEALVEFIAPLTPELIELMNHLQNGTEDIEAEKQIAMNIIRKAKDAQAKKEIVGQ